MIEQAVIMATGYGTRLGLLLKDRPKPMLPVLGKPIVVRVMDRIYEAGIRKFIVIVGEEEGEVAAYLNTSWVPDAQIQIVLVSTPRIPDVLLNASRSLAGPFLLAASDILIPSGHVAALIKRFTDSKADLVMSLASSAPGLGLAAAKVDGAQITEVSGRAPSGRHAVGSFLLYACSKRLINYCSAGGELMSAVDGLLKSGGKVGGVMAEWVLPLNTALDLLTINKRFLREGRDTHILSELPDSVHVTPPVRIDPQVSVGLGAKIGPNVYLESGSHVGPDAVVWDSVVLRNATIAEKEIAHGQIIARRARISEENSSGSG